VPRVFLGPTSFGLCCLVAFSLPYLADFCCLFLFPFMLSLTFAPLPPSSIQFEFSPCLYGPAPRLFFFSPPVADDVRCKALHFSEFVWYQLATFPRFFVLFLNVVGELCFLCAPLVFFFEATFFPLFVFQFFISRCSISTHPRPSTEQRASSFCFGDFLLFVSPPVYPSSSPCETRGALPPAPAPLSFDLLAPHFFFFSCSLVSSVDITLFHLIPCCFFVFPHFPPFTNFFVPLPPFSLALVPGPPFWNQHQLLPLLPIHCPSPTFSVAQGYRLRCVVFFWPPIAPI